MEPLSLTKELAAILMLLGIIPSLLVVSLLRNHEKKPGVIWLVGVAFGFIIWSISFVTIFQFTDTTVVFIAISLFVISPFSTSICWFLFCYEFTFKKSIPTWTYGLFILLLIEFGLALTNPWNVMYKTTLVDGSIFPASIDTLRFFFNVPFSYILVLFGTGMVIGEGMSSDNKLRKKQSSIILLTSAILVFVSLVKVSGIVPVYFDPTPLAVSVGFLLIAYSIETHQLGRQVPIARQKTVELFDEIMIVTNEAGKIIDVNKAARKLFGEDIYKQNINSLFEKHTIENDNILVFESQGFDKRKFHLNENQIMYGRGIQGHIHILSEVTEIKKREEELDIVQTIMQRIFRHNVRNQLTPILGYAQAVKQKATLEPQTKSQLGKIVENSQQLLSTSEKAIEIGKAINNRDLVQTHLQTEFESIVADKKSDFPDATITTEIDDVSVYAHQNIKKVFEEAVENGLIYNSLNEKERNITIKTRVLSNTVRIWIADNGDGIPNSEINVLQSNSETQHQHSNGAGLWLIKWIVESSNGTQKYYSNEKMDGTVLKIELQRNEAATV